jgi:integrase
MARLLIPSDTSIRNLKPGTAPKRFNDGDGLYLLPFVKGGSHGWRFDYTFAGKRKTLSLGTYPDTGLKLAREKAASMREQLAAGVDPSAARQESKAAQAEASARATQEADREAAGLAPVGSFEQVAREWFAKRRGDWAPSYGDKLIRRLEVDVFPWIGREPVASIKPPALLQVLRRIEARGVVETAHRALENCGQVFRYAVSTGQAESNPARDLKDALARPMPRHFPAITDPKRLGELLRAVASYRGTPVVRAALLLTPMLLLRPGELRFARWEEIDLEAAQWLVPAERMKREKVGKVNGKPHLVPLPRQAVAIFRELQPLTGPDGYVFTSLRRDGRAMSDAAINAALRTMGFEASEVTAHGFRATARTMLAEQLDYPDAVIEAQLAHSVRDSLGRAYNRTEFLKQRAAMMQAWADHLDRLRVGADVIPLKPKRTKHAVQ